MQSTSMRKGVAISILLFFLATPLLAAATDQHGRPPSGIPILQEIHAKIPSQLALTIEALTMKAKTIDLRGTAESLDVIQQLKRSLESSPAIMSVGMKMITIPPQAQLTFTLAITPVIP